MGAGVGVGVDLDVGPEPEMPVCGLRLLKLSREVVAVAAIVVPIL